MPNANPSPFDDQTIRFLKQLARNNDRSWFAANKERYERTVLAPALEFIQIMQQPLGKISPHFLAVPKRTGGSLMRVYRDTRFSADKRPYKTNIGIHFRHEMGRDVHAPGFYVHIEPGSSFVGAGIWRPDSRSLNLIREMIDDDPPRWKRITRAKRLNSEFQIAGDRLKRPPRGYRDDHPMIDDLKLKDHIRVCHLTDREIVASDFPSRVVTLFKTARPWMRMLCDALRLPF